MKDVICESYRNKTENAETIVDRLLSDKREAQRQAKENFKKPEYQEALKRLRARN